MDSLESKLRRQIEVAEAEVRALYRLLDLHLNTKNAPNVPLNAMVRKRAYHIGPVLQCDMKGKPVACYSSQSYAAALLGVNRSNITNAANGRIPTAYGFKWKPVDEPPEGVPYFDRPDGRKTRYQRVAKSV
jgi:hypothetical protein